MGTLSHAGALAGGTYAANSVCPLGSGMSRPPQPQILFIALKLTHSRAPSPPFRQFLEYTYIPNPAWGDAFGRSRLCDSPFIEWGSTIELAISSRLLMCSHLANGLVFSHMGQISLSNHLSRESSCGRAQRNHIDDSVNKRNWPRGGNKKIPWK